MYRLGHNSHSQCVTWQVCHAPSDVLSYKKQEKSDCEDAMVDGISHSLEFQWVELLLKQLNLAVIYLHIIIEEKFIR
jgi:hypothetical protein